VQAEAITAVNNCQAYCKPTKSQHIFIGVAVLLD
jgi:hypothetical protein